MESMSVHTDQASVARVIGELNQLRECIIRRIAWDEPGMQLVVQLDYIWTDDGRITFTVGQVPKVLTLTFALVTLLLLKNPLTPPMLEHPDRLDWGISEIAQLDVIESSELDVNDDFVAVRFVWEGRR